MLSEFAFSGRPLARGNWKFGVLLEGISMVAPRASGNKIDNIMVVREFIIFCVIKNHSNSPITIGILILLCGVSLELHHCLYPGMS